MQTDLPPDLQALLYPAPKPRWVGIAKLVFAPIWVPYKILVWCAGAALTAYDTITVKGLLFVLVAFLLFRACS